jgi:hypothetical protein
MLIGSSHYAADWCGLRSRCSAAFSGLTDHLKRLALPAPMCQLTGTAPQRLQRPSSAVYTSAILRRMIKLPI